MPIAEDESTLLDTLEYNLSRQGYEVYTAMDGLAALEVARREPPDLIELGQWWNSAVDLTSPPIRRTDASPAIPL